MKKIKIAAIYRGKILDNRGTPIRARHLCLELDKNSEIDLTVFSWDREAKIFNNHVFLNNNHFEDLKKLYRYVKDKNVDVVIGHTTSSSYYLASLKFLTKAKIVLEMHGLEEEEAREYGDIGLLKYWAFKVWHIIFYFLCDLITTCSKSITHITAKWNRNSVTMCGGVNLAEFNPSTPGGGFVKKDGRIIIGYAGNTRKWQGVDFLLEAYQKILKMTSDFKLCMLMSEKINTPRGVEVIGPVPNEEVPKFLVDCDILVIPRPLSPVTKISYPSKMTEYLGMGKAVVVSNVGDMDLIVKNKVNGLVYTAGNADEFIDAILSLKDSIFRNKLGAEARKTAKHMSWQILGQFFVDKMRELV